MARRVGCYGRGVTSNDLSDRERQRRARLAAQREETRAFKDDQGHSWPETCSHFGISLNAAKSRVYRARKDREAEAVARMQPSLPLDGQAPSPA